MNTIKMGRAGRLDIPLDIWAQIGVKPGDIVELTVTEAGVLEFRKFQGDRWAALRWKVARFLTRSEKR